MLMKLEQFADSLVCPYCHRALKLSSGAIVCEVASCPKGKFPIIGGKPNLINPANSVANGAEVGVHGGKQTVRGRARNKWVRRIAWLIWKSGLKSGHNLRRLTAMLPQALTMPRVLVIGGAVIGDGLAPIYVDSKIGVIGLDLHDSPIVQLIADAHVVPLADSSVDAVIVQAVLEHVLEPQKVVSEIHRVLKPGGLVYSETPFLQQVHEGAYDFTRYTASGHRYLFREFEEIDTGLIGGVGTQLLWSIDHSARALFRSRAMGLAARALFFWIRFLDLISDPKFTLDSASATYFLGKRSERRLSGLDIVSWYRGAQR